MNSGSSSAGTNGKANGNGANGSNGTNANGSKTNELIGVNRSTGSKTGSGGHGDNVQGRDLTVDGSNEKSGVQEGSLDGKDGSRASSTSKANSTSNAQTAESNGNSKAQTAESKAQSALQAQDDEIFERARLVNCAFFMQVILRDYVGGILGLVRDGSTWRNCLRVCLGGRMLRR